MRSSQEPKYIELAYIYFKEIDLVTENTSTIDLTKNNTIKKIKLSPRGNYIVTNLKVNRKIETDIRK